MAKKIKYSKEKNLKILDHKINKMDQKIAAFTQYGISEHKIAKLQMKKNRYNNKKTEIEAS